MFFFFLEHRLPLKCFDNFEKFFNSSILMDIEDVCTESRSDGNLLIKNQSYSDKLSSVDPKFKLLIAKWITERDCLKEKFKDYGFENFPENNAYIGGVDVSFPSEKKDLVHACASIAVLSYPDLKTVYENAEIVHLTSIYVPQFLAYREFEPIKNLFNQLRKSAPQYFPHLVLVDGNGVLHPQKFGFACHLGVSLDIPTIGVAKKLFRIDDLQNDDSFKKKIKLLNKKGDTFELVNNGFTYGKALRSTEKSSNPIFVSIGNNISLNTAVEIVNNCCKFRVPEPIRHADQIAKEYLRKNYASHVKSCNSYDELNKHFNEISLKLCEEK